MIKAGFLLCLLAASVQLWAQDFNHYQPLVNSGSIPDEYISEAALIGFEDLTPAQNSNSYTEQKSRLEFIRYSDFYIRYLLRSGDLMFGDPLTEYVNKVADNLMKDAPELREKFRFYVTRYPEVNAACLPNGIVLVNIGLLAQLENEAQLAFTIAHEMVHYVKKHGIDAFIEQNRMKRNTSDFRSFTKDERIFAMLQYQKDLEFKADELGFTNYFVNSGYKLSEAEALCDVLLYSDFPIDEVPFTRANVEDEWFKLPVKYWKDTVDVITAIEDFDDAKLTHPNIKKRRENIQGMLATNPDKGSEFIEPREDFLRIRDIARFEMCNLYLIERQYADAIYLVNVLKQKFPDSEYLQKANAKSWYGLVRLVREKETRIALRTASKVKGESQRLFFLLKSMSNNELIIMACRELWKSHEALPSDASIAKMTEQAFTYLMSISKLRTNYFVFNEPRSDTATVDASVSDSTAEMSKYDKIKQNQTKISSVDPFQMAFLSFAKQDQFLTFYNRIKANTSDEDNEETDFQYPRRHGIKKDPNLGTIDNLMILDPMYIRISSQKKAEERFLASSRYEKAFIESFTEMAPRTGMKYTMYDASAFGVEDVDKYNDFQLLKEWFNEYNEEDSVLTMSSSQERLDDLADRNNTPYVALTGVVSERTRRNPYIAVYSVIIPPLFPIALAYVMLPKFETLYFFEVYDITNGKMVYSEMRLVSGRDYKYTLSQMVYSTFYNLKNN